MSPRRPSDPAAEGLLIRADAGALIGVGHAMRCLALAQAWRDAGRGPVWLASNDLPEGIAERYAREGVAVRPVDGGLAGLQDALREVSATWVVLDGYTFGVSMQQAVKASQRRLLVVDDDGAAGPAYVADLVVDANVFADRRGYELCPPSTRLLLGPDYALLRAEMRRTAADAASRRAHAGTRRLLVTFGGADPAGLSLVAVRALAGTGLEVTLVVGPANERRAELERAAAQWPDVTVVAGAGNMRDLMDRADLALVAAGGTCLELAHAGVPQIVVATADNQIRVARALAARGVARSLGEARCVGAEGLREAVVSLFADEDLRRQMAQRGVELVDGRGAERVAEAMSRASD